MTWATELIDRIPDIVDALAPGFLLLTSFSWTTSKRYGSGTTVVIISAVLSYVISQISSIFCDTNSAAKTIIVYTLSTLFGFILALAYKSSWFGKFLAWIGVKRTVNDSIWDDVLGEAAWVAIYDSKIDGYYCGQFQYQNYESEREYVVIAAYYIADSQGNVLENHTKDLECKLMVDTATCGKIIISPKDPFNHFEPDTEKDESNDKK